MAKKYSTPLSTVKGQMRAYPPVLAGSLYPHGIPTIPEPDLARFIKERRIKLVVLAYSDLSYAEVSTVAHFSDTVC